MLIDMYKMEVTWNSARPLAESDETTNDVLNNVPFTSTSDKQAVLDVLTHVDTICEVYGLVASFVRVSTLSVGPIGAHGEPDEIRAATDRILYEYTVAGGCSEFNILDRRPSSPAGSL